MPSPDNMIEHVTKTYFKTRIGVAVIGIALPFLLWLGGLFYDVQLQESMSAYYHANAIAEGGADLTANDGVMRNCFVGFLFAVGFMLFLYQGYSPRENILLNIAGIMAVGVAIFPMTWPKGAESESFSLHGTCAVLFFICIAAVSITCNARTLPLIENENLRKYYKNVYRVICGVMILSPILAFIFSSVIKQESLMVFFIEAFGVFAFGTYWIVKSVEISKITKIKNEPEFNIF